MTTTLDVNPAVADFASGVRRSLSDLGAEVVDELTDGLEADLADKLEDGADLGDPAAYAAELRAAAGLEAPRHPTVSDNVRANLADLRSRFSPLVAHPVVEFLFALRPLWWIARALALFGIVNWHRPGSVVPNDPFQMLVLAVLTVGSIQWGRGKWLPFPWSKPAVVALSLIAALMIPQVAYITDLQRQEWASGDDGQKSGGLLLDGSEVTNIFAYGRDGELLTDVQLFDQSGNPLQVIPDAWNVRYTWMADGSSDVLVPSDDVAGGSGWNVYPLESVSSESIDDYGIDIDRGAVRRPVPPPFDSVRHLIGYGPLGDAERDSLETYRVD